MRRNVRKTLHQSKDNKGMQYLKDRIIIIKKHMSEGNKKIRVIKVKETR